MADLREKVHTIAAAAESSTTTPLQEVCGATTIASGGAARRVYADPAKALVMAYLSRLVAGGLADWNRIDSGDVKLELHSGETFILSDETILRVT
jgi:hypothetical protein